MDYASKLYVPVDFFTNKAMAEEVVLLLYMGHEDDSNGGSNDDDQETFIGEVVQRTGERGCDLRGDWAAFAKKNGIRPGRTYCFWIDTEEEDEDPEGIAHVLVWDHRRTPVEWRIRD